MATFSITIEAEDLADLESQYESMGVRLFGFGEDEDTVPEAVAIPAATPGPPALAVVPPQPTAVLPAAPLAAVVAAANLEMDARNFAWDERIHTAKRTFNKDGSWRYRRNLDKALIAQVEVELAAGAPVAAPATESIEPPPPVPGLPQAVATTPPASGGHTVANCIALATAMLGAAESDEARLEWAAAAIKKAMVDHGIPSQIELINRPDLAPAIYEALATEARKLGVQC